MKPLDCDSISISQVGYKSKIIAINDLSPENNICLESDIKLLDDLLVFGNCQTYKHTIKYSDGDKGDRWRIPMNYGLQHALYFSVVDEPLLSHDCIV